jgi:hypothetical protein
MYFEVISSPLHFYLLLRFPVNYMTREVLRFGKRDDDATVLAESTSPQLLSIIILLARDHQLPPTLCLESTTITTGMSCKCYLISCFSMCLFGSFRFPISHATFRMFASTRRSPQDIQEAAAALGYNKAMWDSGKDPKECNVYWKELSDTQQAAATKLGYSQAEWDSS